MTAVVVILIVLFVAFLVWLGYYLWDISLERYDYNIYGLGVIIRGIICGVSLFLGLVTIEVPDGSTYVFLGVSIVMLLWTFIITGIRTNFLIAFFAFFYQMLFFIGVVLLLLNVTNGGKREINRAEVKLPRNHKSRFR